MGILLSRLRGKPSAKAVLEELHKEIEELEDYNRSTEQQQKHLVGSLILYSVILYLGFATIFYLYYFPNNLRDQLIYSIPLLIFPAIIWLLKQLLYQYFVNKLRKNEEHLERLKKKRRTVLDLAMETETYKVAKDLLEKYDPEFQKKAVVGKFGEPVPKRSAHEELRRRAAASQGLPPPSNAQQQLILSSGHGVPKPYTPFPAKPPHLVAPFLASNNKQWVKTAIPPMPRPILPRERTVIDRILDYLVADGPSNRFALVCKQCESHNGMALKEEFEYLAFRCCYCFHWNPARKQRPIAPRLPLPLPHGGEEKSEDSEDKDQSGADSRPLEIEEVTDDPKVSSRPDEHQESSETESTECFPPEETAKSNGKFGGLGVGEETESNVAK
ncbi:endoplasmic reticulum junction formation protein lunapark-A-like isoform X1 [Centruroides sculpturatus]|uniref:endoplasmic reticulum junction formation protein lunapark-A-like isoform X1 n=1 Tax=Centruroides sculpturatus TaxID=218467 RepID=UPI000C6EEFC7|nr:endoplasmic reticulum junction formation protein lunapark-A-like isoform X1 [Centruroides sculpturatus]